MRRGVRLGIDVGSVRVGVAACDPDGVLATPVETVRRDPGAADLARIALLAAERAAIEVVVGLPRTLAGREGRAAQAARAYAGSLAARVTPCPVRLVDERLSTVIAARGMQAGGVSARKGRGTVDKAAAAVILQAALDIERGSGRPPGEIVQVDR
ncbi:MAG: Holliday junction resolvase RuvX [Jiangellaceae bacterium]